MRSTGSELVCNVGIGKGNLLQAVARRDNHVTIRVAILDRRRKEAVSCLVSAVITASRGKDCYTFVGTGPTALQANRGSEEFVQALQRARSIAGTFIASGDPFRGTLMLQG